MVNFYVNPVLLMSSRAVAVNNIRMRVKQASEICAEPLEDVLGKHPKREFGEQRTNGHGHFGHPRPADRQGVEYLLDVNTQHLGDAGCHRPTRAGLTSFPVANGLLANVELPRNLRLIQAQCLACRADKLTEVLSHVIHIIRTHAMRTTSGEVGEVPADALICLAVVIPHTSVTSRDRGKRALQPAKPPYVKMTETTQLRRDSSTGHAPPLTTMQ